VAKKIDLEAVPVMKGSRHPPPYDLLRAGDCAGFKAGVADGHHLQNRTTRDARYLDMGSRCPKDDEVIYPDIDLRSPKGRDAYAHANGELYTDTKPRIPGT
jgi:uncharacterized cupin superfamily protein